MFVSQYTFGDLRSQITNGGSCSTERSLSEKLPSFRHFGPSRQFEIRLAYTARERKLACKLLNRMYDWRGYGADHEIRANEQSSTFVASLGKAVVGTLTLTVDSDVGLASDKTFGDVLDEARAVTGSALCELTKFACSPSEDSRRLLASLFHTIFIYGTERHRCTDLFIEVNPRHIRFYEIMLGFRKVGGLRINQAVEAPSQLMCLKVDDIARNIERHAGHDPKAMCRSLYPFFFNQAEEEELRSKVRDTFKATIPARILAAQG